MSKDPVAMGQLALAIMTIPLAGLALAALCWALSVAWRATFGKLVEHRAQAQADALARLRAECRTPNVRHTRLCGHAADCRIFGTGACGLTEAA